MSWRYENPAFKPVERAGSGCGGCAFELSVAASAEDCAAHPCFAGDFPEDHPMRKAEMPIIWVAK